MRRKLQLLLLIVIVIGVDQWTKAIARRTLISDSPRHFGIVTLLYTTNAGAFLSLGSNLPADARAAIFSGIVTIALGAAAIALFGGKIQSSPDEVALSLILGGGIGNLIDRLRFGGRVTDFLYLAAGPLHTGVFNIADTAITGGILWLAIAWGAASYSSMRKRRKR